MGRFGVVVAEEGGRVFRVPAHSRYTSPRILNVER
jgi:hypothetical protein